MTKRLKQRLLVLGLTHWDDARLQVAAQKRSSPNPEPQTSNAGRRKLAVHLRGVENTRVQVTMAP